MIIHVYKNADNDSNILICGSTLIRDSTLVYLSFDKTFKGGVVPAYYISLDGKFVYDSIYFFQANAMGLGYHVSFNMKGKK